MAYVDYYKTDFYNDRNERVICTIAKNNGTVGTTVQSFDCTAFEINVNDGDTLFSSILTRELVMTWYIGVGDPVAWDTFIASTNDDWRVIATIDGQYVFHGFIVPDVGPSPWQDKPYEVTIRASDGLKLLKNIPFTDINGNEFVGTNTFLMYMLGALAKTNLGLNLLSYCNIYNNIMFVRATDSKNDMLAQCSFDYRTFQKSPTEYVSCYDALMILFKDHFRLFYWLGEWILYRIPEYQFLASGQQRWVTVYGPTGTALSGYTDTFDIASIGQKEAIYPINENQLISSQLANKSVKHRFPYDIWPELPLNNKFERVDLDPFISNATQKFYTIRNWNSGQLLNGNAPVVIPTARKAWRVSLFDTFGIETDRYLQLQCDVSQALQSAPFPVLAQSRINLSYSIKYEAGITNAYPVTVYIVPNSGAGRWLLNANGTWSFTTTSLNGIYNDYSNLDPTQWNSWSVNSTAIPANGQLYIAFWATTGFGANRYYKDISVNYTPYTAGGYNPVLGDYWYRDQAPTYLDKVDDDIQISDCREWVVKGCILTGPNNGTLMPTTPQWYRYGLGNQENMHYKELVNLGVYNMTYRRFLRIEGDWDGTKYVPQSDRTQSYPVSFHMRYNFTDYQANRLFVMLTPFRMDVIKARFNAVFQEVYADQNDGAQTGNNIKFTYQFK